MRLATLSHRMGRMVQGWSGLEPVDHASTLHQSVRVQGEYGARQTAARLQPYGLASDPPADIEYLGLQLAGCAELLAVIDGGAQDRPRDLVLGETRLYNQRDSRVQMLPDGTLVVTNLLGEVRISPDGSILLTPLVGGPTSILVQAAGVVVTTPIGIATFDASGALHQAGPTLHSISPTGMDVVGIAHNLVAAVACNLTAPLFSTVGALKATGCPPPTEPLDYASKGYVDAVTGALGPQGDPYTAPTVSEDPPAGAAEGDEWIRSSDWTRFSFDGTRWIEQGGGFPMIWGRKGASSGGSLGVNAGDVFQNKTTKALKLSRSYIGLHALARSKEIPDSGEKVTVWLDSVDVLTLTWSGSAEIEDASPALLLPAGSEIAVQVIEVGSPPTVPPTDWQFYLHVKEYVEAAA